jgi:putative mRNA 3-end processing factor
MSDLLERTANGLYCPEGDFYIDPWGEVPRAIITHAHADHARPGSSRYATAQCGVELLRLRLGDDAQIDGWHYGERVQLGSVCVSLHPAGHVLGSAQVRMEHRGEIWVVSGDYKTASDATCQPLEPLACHTFVTESTFGMPIFHWRPEEEIVRDVHQWWSRNQERGRTSVVFAYSLGKAQRLLARLDPQAGPILVHGAVLRYLPAYERCGARFPPLEHASGDNRRQTRGRALVVAPPSAAGTPWLRSMGDVSTAIASGWMQICGVRRRRAVDRGFVLSDHADWPGLLATIRATGAWRVWVTHGFTQPMARWLREQGIDAQALATEFVGETAEVEAAEEEQSESP